jgi:MFS transporter, Spinster family, sphingosine-1-phosphate transporter
MSQVEQRPSEPGGAPPSPADEVPSKGKAKWGKYGRKPVALIAGVGLIDSIDRGILPGVLVAVQEELGLNDFQLGLLDSAYVIVGLLFAVPAGYLSDRKRRTKIIGATMVFWALMCAVTATVRNFGQFFLTRAALGAGDTLNNPSAQSLLADYYSPKVRGRAYAYYRVTPTLGRALGIILGGAVAVAIGWRGAFLLVCLPGVAMGIAMWRLREPARGESDGLAPAKATPTETRTRSSIWADYKVCFSIRSLRSLVIGIALANGALAGIGFWAAAYNFRHSGMSMASAGGVTGALILVGAMSGTILGGHVADRVRDRFPGAPMVAAGMSIGLGAILVFISVFDAVPVWSVRVPMHIVAVGLLVGGLPATYAMVSEVSVPKLRGTAFALVNVSSVLLGALSPPLLGLIADSRQVLLPSGEMAGNLAFGFQAMVPIVLIGAVVLVRGGKTVAEDRRKVRELMQAELASRSHDEDRGAHGEPGGGAAAGGVAADRSTAVHHVAADPPTDADPSAALHHDLDPPDPVDPSGDATVELPPASGDPDARHPRFHGAQQQIYSVTKDFGRRLATNLLPVLATVFAVLGVVALVLGWRGASRTPEVFEQVPFLLSGGLLGVAFLALSGLFVLGHAIARTARRRQERNELRQAVVDELRRDLGDDAGG